MGSLLCVRYLLYMKSNLRKTWQYHYPPFGNGEIISERLSNSVYTISKKHNMDSNISAQCIAIKCSQYNTLIKTQKISMNTFNSYSNYISERVQENIPYVILH